MIGAINVDCQVATTPERKFIPMPSHQARRANRWLDELMSCAVHQRSDTLHPNIKHLLGNVLIGGALFAIVHRRLGPSLGSISVLMSGVVGNLMNAVMHLTGHRSFGASTAVMGALGILAATQLAMNQTRRPTAKAVVT
ncbi:MAG: rhomboid family intramembrane serine protease [Polyangiaceae bacterium]|nr:rhomboid family intramembrane serine protease [Polyangiaceae bacterium]